MTRQRFDVSTPDGLFPWERQVIESVLGAGAFDDVDFIVYWCKYRDDEFNGEQWDGWPFRRDVGTMYRVDDPNDWKHTWFVFTH